MKNRTRWILAALAGSVLLGLTIAWSLTPLRDWLTFDRLVEMDSEIQVWLVDHFFLGCLLFVLTYVLASALSLPGVSLLSFTGGFLFGPWLNPVLINLGGTTGAVILFGLARSTLGEGLRARFEAKLAPVYQETEAHGAAYLLSLRFLPAIPFFLVNLIGGLGGFRFRTFLWTTSLGILPGSIVNSLLGWSAGQILENPGPLPWPVYVALGSLAALSLSTIAFRWLGSASPATRVVIVPGWQNSDENHWQTLWQRNLPGARRFLPGSWEEPRRVDWVDALAREVDSATGPVVLVAHSLGCCTVLHAAAEGKLGKVVGAFLVALPDADRADFPPVLEGFSPLPRQRLPFPSLLVTSEDDPYMDSEVSREWASVLGAEQKPLGLRGHLGSQAGLGTWSEGRRLFEAFAGSLPFKSGT